MRQDPARGRRKFDHLRLQYAEGYADQRSLRCQGERIAALVCSADGHGTAPPTDPLRHAAEQDGPTGGFNLSRQEPG